MKFCANGKSFEKFNFLCKCPKHSLHGLALKRRTFSPHLVKVKVSFFMQTLNFFLFQKDFFKLQFRLLIICFLISKQFQYFCRFPIRFYQKTAQKKFVYFSGRSDSCGSFCWFGRIKRRPQLNLPPSASWSWIGASAVGEETCPRSWTNKAVPSPRDD